jgi:hypothetical protein
MRVVINNSGMAVGGNESYSNKPNVGTKVGKSSERLKNNKVTKQNCLGVFKKVHVINVKKLI